MLPIQEHLSPNYLPTLRRALLRRASYLVLPLGCKLVGVSVLTV